MYGEDRKLWTTHIGDSWTLPTDHRIDLGFQKDSLDKLSAYDLKHRLAELQLFNNTFLNTMTPLDTHAKPQRRNWFRHFTIEDTAPQPPFATQTYDIGQREARTNSHVSHTLTPDPLEQRASLYARHHYERQTVAHKESCAPRYAPWQRLM